MRCALSSVSSEPVRVPPPYPEAPRRMPHAEISVQHDPIRAIVAAAQQFGISIAQCLRHAWELSIFSGVTPNAYLPLRFAFYCPERAPFSRRSPRKSVQVNQILAQITLRCAHIDVEFLQIQKQAAAHRVAIAFAGAGHVHG